MPHLVPPPCSIVAYGGYAIDVTNLARTSLGRFSWSSVALLLYPPLYRCGSRTCCNNSLLTPPNSDLDVSYPPYTRTIFTLTLMIVDAAPLDAPCLPRTPYRPAMAPVVSSCT